MEDNKFIDYSYVYSTEEESQGSIESESDTFEFEGFDIQINEKVILMPLKTI